MIKLTKTISLIPGISFRQKPKRTWRGGLRPSFPMFAMALIVSLAIGNLHCGTSSGDNTEGNKSIIITVAGNGLPGYSGDGSQATSAKLKNPSGVAVDSFGSFYIADNYNQRIRKVTASGIITTVAGNDTQGYAGDGGQAASAELNDPSGVAVDSSGNLYIADYGNNRIRKVYGQ